MTAQTPFAVLHPYYKLAYIKLSWGGPEEQAAEIANGNLGAKDWQDEARKIVENTVSRIASLTLGYANYNQNRWLSTTELAHLPPPPKDQLGTKIPHPAWVTPYRNMINTVKHFSLTMRRKAGPRNFDGILVGCNGT